MDTREPFIVCKICNSFIHHSITAKMYLGKGGTPGSVGYLDLCLTEI